MHRMLWLPLLTREQVKLWTSYLAGTFTGSIRTKAHYNLEKRERGHVQGMSNFLDTPIISETGKATDFKFCAHIYTVNRPMGVVMES